MGLPHQTDVTLYLAICEDLSGHGLEFDADGLHPFSPSVAPVEIVGNRVIETAWLVPQPRPR
jgi:hypothetical protein